jgi:hypothetical protein
MEDRGIHPAPPMHDIMSSRRPGPMFITVVASMTGPMKTLWIYIQHSDAGDDF